MIEHAKTCKHVLPSLVIAADWSTDERKRWMVRAERVDSCAYVVYPPEPVGRHDDSNQPASKSGRRERESANRIRFPDWSAGCIREARGRDLFSKSNEPVRKRSVGELLHRQRFSQLATTVLPATDPQKWRLQEPTREGTGVPRPFTPTPSLRLENQYPEGGRMPVLHTGRRTSRCRGHRRLARSHSAIA